MAAIMALPKLCKLTSSFMVSTQRYASMKAWQAYKYGGSDQLTLNSSSAVPVIKSPKDVLVDVHACSINPIDIAMLAGYGSATLPAIQKLACSGKSLSDLPKHLPEIAKIPFQDNTVFPITLGRDFSGIVKETGQEAAAIFKPGDEVWGVVNPLKSNHGSHAEFTLVSVDDLTHKPQSLSHIDAASLPYVTCTTWASATIFANLKPNRCHGKRALILGGSGGVGTFAIQLLKAWGAHVTTTCSSDAMHNLTLLGADVAIDYKTNNVLSELKQLASFDYILDGTKNQGKDTVAEYLKLLRTNSNAHYVTLNSSLLRNNDELGFPFGLAKSFMELSCLIVDTAKQGRHYRWGLYVPSTTALDAVAQLVDNNKIQPVVECVYGFNQVPEAFGKVQAGHNRGKTVIDVKQQENESQ